MRVSFVGAESGGQGPPPSPICKASATSSSPCFPRDFVSVGLGGRGIDNKEEEKGKRKGEEVEEKRESGWRAARRTRTS